WHRPAGAIRYRHGRAVPGREADARHGECQRVRPGLPSRLQRVPSGSPTPDRGCQPGEEKNDLSRRTEHLLGVQSRRGNVRQLDALEKPAVPTSTTLLWEGNRPGGRVSVWGGRPATSASGLIVPKKSQNHLQDLDEATLY